MPKFITRIVALVLAASLVQEPAAGIVGVGFHPRPQWEMESHGMAGRHGDLPLQRPLFSDQALVLALPNFVFYPLRTGKAWMDHAGGSWRRSYVGRQIYFKGWAGMLAARLSIARDAVVKLFPHRDRKQPPRYTLYFATRPDNPPNGPGSLIARLNRNGILSNEEFTLARQIYQQRSRLKAADLLALTRVFATHKFQTGTAKDWIILVFQRDWGSLTTQALAELQAPLDRAVAEYNLTEAQRLALLRPLMTSVTVPEGSEADYTALGPSWDNPKNRWSRLLWVRMAVKSLQTEWQAGFVTMDAVAERLGITEESLRTFIETDMHLSPLAFSISPLRYSDEAVRVAAYAMRRSPHEALYLVEMEIVLGSLRGEFRAWAQDMAPPHTSKMVYVADRYGIFPKTADKTTRAPRRQWAAAYVAENEIAASPKALQKAMRILATPETPADVDLHQWNAKAGAYLAVKPAEKPSILEPSAILRWRMTQWLRSLSTASTVPLLQLGEIEYQNVHVKVEGEWRTLKAFYETMLKNNDTGWNTPYFILQRFGILPVVTPLKEIKTIKDLVPALNSGVVKQIRGEKMTDELKKELVAALAKQLGKVPAWLLEGDYAEPLELEGLASGVRFDLDAMYSSYKVQRQGLGDAHEKQWTSVFIAQTLGFIPKDPMINHPAELLKTREELTDVLAKGWLWEVPWEHLNEDIIRTLVTELAQAAGLKSVHELRKHHYEDIRLPQLNITNRKTKEVKKPTMIALYEHYHRLNKTDMGTWYFIIGKLWPPGSRGKAGGRDYSRLLPGQPVIRTHAEHEGIIDAFLARFFQGGIPGMRWLDPTHYVRWYDPSARQTVSFILDVLHRVPRLDHFLLYDAFQQLVDRDFYRNGRTPRGVLRIFRLKGAPAETRLPAQAHVSDRRGYLFYDLGAGPDPFGSRKESRLLIHELMADLGVSDEAALALEILEHGWMRGYGKTIEDLLNNPHLARLYERLRSPGHRGLSLSEAYEEAMEEVRDTLGLPGGRDPHLLKKRSLQEYLQEAGAGANEPVRPEDVSYRIPDAVAARSMLDKDRVAGILPRIAWAFRRLAHYWNLSEMFVPVDGWMVHARFADAAKKTVLFFIAPASEVTPAPDAAVFKIYELQEMGGLGRDYASDAPVTPGTDAPDEAPVNETITRAEALHQSGREDDALNLLAPILNEERVEGFLATETAAKIAAYQRIARIVEAVQQKSNGILTKKAKLLHQLAFALSSVRQREDSARLFEKCFSTLESLAPLDPQRYLEVSAAAYLSIGKAELNEWDYHKGSFTHLVDAARMAMTSLAYQEKAGKSDLGEQQISLTFSLLGWIHYHALWMEDQDSEEPLLNRAGYYAQEALKHGQPSANALTLKGTLLLKAGDAREAVNFFEEALKALKLGDWSVTRIGLLSALLREYAWSDVADRFNTVTYAKTLEAYGKGLELAREADGLWTRDRTQAVKLYKEALRLWDIAFDGRVVDLIGVRENYARAVEDLFRVEVRSGEVSQGIETVIAMLRIGMVKCRSLAALIAEDLPVESYPELADSLRSLVAAKENVRAVARLARLLYEHLKKQPGYVWRSREAMQKLVQELDPQGEGEKEDLRESRRRVSALASALKPVKVSVPVQAESPDLLFKRATPAATPASTGAALDLTSFVLPVESSAEPPQIGVPESPHGTSVRDLESDLSDLGLLIRKKLEKISPAPQDQLIFERLNNLFERLAGHDYDEVYQLARDERDEPGQFLEFSQKLADADAKALNAIFDYCYTIALTYQKLHDRRGPERSRGDELLRARAYLAVAQRLTDGRPSAVPVMDRLTLCTNLGQIENELDHPDQAFVQTDRALKLSRLIRQALTGPHAVPRDDISPRDGERLRSTAQDTEKKVAGEEGLALSIRGSGHQLKLEWAKAADVFLKVRHNSQRFENLSASEQQNIRFHLAYSLYIHHRAEPVKETVGGWEIEAQEAAEELSKSELAAEFGLLLSSLCRLLLIREKVRRGKLEEARLSAMQILDDLLTEAGIEFSGPHNPLLLLVQHANDPNVEAVFSRHPGLQDLIEEDVLVWLMRCAEPLGLTLEAAWAADAINLLKGTAMPGEVDGLQFNSAEALFNQGQYEEAIVPFQQALDYRLRSTGMPPELGRWLTLLLGNEDPNAVFSKMQDAGAGESYHRVAEYLGRRPDGLTEVVTILERLGFCCSRSFETSPEAALRARNYLTAAARLMENRTSVAVSARLEVWLELSRTLAFLDDNNGSLDYAQRAVALCRQVVVRLRGGSVEERVITQSELQELRLEGGSIQRIQSQEATAHYRAAWAFYWLSQWKDSAEHLKEALRLKPSPEEETNARLMLGLVGAKQQEWDGLPEAALEGLVAGCATVLGVEVIKNPGEYILDALLGAIDIAVEPLKARLRADRDSRALAGEFFRAMEHLLGVLGQAGRMQELQRAIERLFPEPPAEGGEPKVDEQAAEEALAELQSLLPQSELEKEELMYSVRKVHRILTALNRHQEILDAFVPLIQRLEDKWSKASVLRRYILADMHNLRATSFINLGKLSEALGTVKLAYGMLDDIKVQCRQNEGMQEWQLAWDNIQRTHGIVLRRSWEQNHHNEADLRKAHDLLKPLADKLSSVAETAASAEARNVVFANLGWVSFYLYGIEQNPTLAATYLKEAEDDAKIALNASPEDVLAIALRDAIAKTRQADAVLRETQRELLAALDAAIQTGDLEAASEQLDLLEETKWPALRVTYYRGLIAYETARKAGDPKEALAQDQEALRIWTAQPVEKLVGAWDSPEKGIEVRRLIIETQVRTGHVREAVAMAKPLLELAPPDLDPKDDALAKRLVAVLPDAPSYQRLSEELSRFQPSPAVDAFATRLETCLTQKQPAPAWRETALASIRDIKSKDVVLQRKAEEEWATLPKGDAKLLDRFFSKKLWELLTPERKAKLLVAWGPAFLKVKKTGQDGQKEADGRRLVIARFVEEVRRAVKAGVTEERGVVRVSIGKMVLESVQGAFVTDMEGAPKNVYGFNIRYISQITDVLRGLKPPLDLGLASYSAQMAAEDFAKADRTIEALASKTEAEVLADPEAALAAVDAQEKVLNTTLRGLIPPGPAGQALSDRRQAMTRRISTERQRVVNVPWLGLQRRVDQLTAEADDATLAAIDKDLGGLQSTLKLKDRTPEPADLPQMISTALAAARLRVSDYRLSREREALVRSRTDYEAKVKLFETKRNIILTAAWGALEKDLGGLGTAKDHLRLPDLRTRMTTLQAASSAILEFAGRPAAFEVLWESAVRSIADAKRKEDLDSLSKEWDALEKRAAIDMSLAALEADGQDLVGRSPSTTFPELAARVSGWPDRLESARKRIKLHEETAARDRKILDLPVVRALVPKGSPAETPEQVVKAVADSLGVPGNQEAVRAWLSAGDETEWQKNGLDLATGFTLSELTRDKLRQRTGAKGQNELDQAYARVKKMKLIQQIRQSRTPPMFISTFELAKGRIVQCEIEMTDLLPTNGQAHPVVLRLGAAESRNGSPPAVRMAVLLPIPARNASSDQLEPAIRTALLMGMGFSQAEASAVANIHQLRGTTFEVYRLPNPSAESGERLNQCRLARAKPDPNDSDAPRRTLLAIGLAESENGGSLNGVTSAAADTRGEPSAEALALARYDFIHKYLAAWPTEEATPAAASRAVSELDLIFDAWIAALAEASSRYEKDMDLIAALRAEWKSMHDRREKALKQERQAERDRLAAKESQAARQAGVSGLLDKLKTFFESGGALEGENGIRRWLQDAGHVLDVDKGVHPELEHKVPPDIITILKDSLSQIRQMLGEGDEMDGILNKIWWALYNHLGLLNHRLFIPVMNRWLWLDFEPGVAFSGVHVDAPLVMSRLPVSQEDGFTFLLVSENHEPGYWHGQRLAILSKEWLENLFVAELRSKGTMNELEKWTFKRRLVEREVIGSIRQAVETTMIRTIVARYEGDEEGISSALQPESPRLQDLQQMTEPELLEIARQFSRLIHAQGPDDIQGQLYQLRDGALAGNKASLFVWKEVFVQFGRPNRLIIELVRELKTMKSGKVCDQFKALMNAHLRLPIQHGLLPHFDNGRSELRGPARDLLEAIYEAMGLDKPPTGTVPPSQSVRGGGSRPGQPSGSRTPGRPSGRDGPASRPGGWIVAMGLALAARVVFAPAAEPLGSAALVGVTLLGFMFWMMEASTRSVGWPVGEAKLGGAA